jgi:hypothetical protein
VISDRAEVACHVPSTHDRINRIARRYPNDPRDPDDPFPTG